MMPVFNRSAQKWVVTINGQVRFYDFFDEAIQALVRAA